MLSFLPFVTLIENECQEESIDEESSSSGSNVGHHRRKDIVINESRESRVSSSLSVPS